MGFSRQACWSVCHSLLQWATFCAALNMPANLENSADWKRSVFIPIPKKGNANECSNYPTIGIISHARKVMLKILQLSFNSTWTKNSWMFKLDFKKAEEQEIKLPTSTGSQKKQENSRKICTFSSLTTLKPLIVWITGNCGKILKT